MTTCGESDDGAEVGLGVGGSVGVLEGLNVGNWEGDDDGMKVGL